MNGIAEAIAAILLVLGSMSAAAEPAEPVSQQSWQVAEEVVVTEDDQGDQVVRHPGEPFVFTKGNCFLEVIPTVVDQVPSIGIFASPAGVSNPTNEQWFSWDGPSAHARVDLPTSVATVWWYDVVVIVNGHSQVSNLHGELVCDG